MVSLQSAPCVVVIHQSGMLSPLPTVHKLVLVDKCKINIKKSSNSGLTKYHVALVKAIKTCPPQISTENPCKMIAFISKHSQKFMLSLVLFRLDVVFSSNKVRWPGDLGGVVCSCSWHNAFVCQQSVFFQKEEKWSCTSPIPLAWSLE